MYGKTAYKFNKTWSSNKQIILDNECIKDLKTALSKHNISYKLTPPNMHQRNSVKRSICTYKNHLLSGLATCNPEFPVSKWDCLIQQVTLTLNFLRSSRVNPNLSACSYVFENFTFNQTLLAQLGTQGTKISPIL